MGKNGTRARARARSDHKDPVPHSSRTRAFPNLANLSTTDLLHLTLTTTTTQKPSLSRLSLTHSILLIGEGDFTFARALATALGTGANIVATSFDSVKDVTNKYDSTLSILADLRRLSVTIIHSIDASKLSNHATTHRLMGPSANPSNNSSFARILFNFPHIGGSSPNDIIENTTLLSEFFIQSLSILAPQGEVHVSLRQTPFYDSWDIESVARSAGLSLKSKTEFERELFEGLGYRPQRTVPAVRDAPTLENALVWIFERTAGEGRVAGSKPSVAKGPVKKGRGKIPIPKELTDEPPVSVIRRKRKFGVARVQEIPTKQTGGDRIGDLEKGESPNPDSRKVAKRSTGRVTKAKHVKINNGAKVPVVESRTRDGKWTVSSK